MEVKITTARSELDPATPVNDQGQYLEADLAAKEAVLRRLDDPHRSSARFRPGDRLLAFLQAL
jgi:hypothetical protein